MMSSNDNKHNKDNIINTNIISIGVMNPSTHINTLLFESNILSKLIYRNHNQHRHTKAFHCFKKLSKELSIVLSFDLVDLINVAKNYLEINYRSSSEVISNAINVYLRLIKATRYVLQVVEKTVVAGRVVQGQLSIGLFGPLYSILVALSSSVFVALSSLVINLYGFSDVMQQPITLLRSTNKVKDAHRLELQNTFFTSKEIETIAGLKSNLMPASASASIPTRSSTTQSSSDIKVDKGDATAVGVRSNMYALSKEEEDMGEVLGFAEPESTPSTAARLKRKL